MFTTAQSKASLLEHWVEGVARYIGQENTRDILHEKAALISAFILHHYDIPCEAVAYRSPIDDDTECELKLEAAASWYRIIDDLSYRFIRPDRDLFCDYLQDALAHNLALQGCSVVSILDRAQERGEEYARLREWVLACISQAAVVFWRVWGRFPVILIERRFGWAVGGPFCG